jgi:transposase-like protein
VKGQVLEMAMSGSSIPDTARVLKINTTTIILSDKEVIAACDEQGIAMVMTGVRCFRH